MNETDDSQPDRAAVTMVETIVASQLHITDAVRRDGALHTVTSLRLQGVPPEVCVELAGLAGRQHYLASAELSVVRHRRSRSDF